MLTTLNYYNCEKCFADYSNRIMNIRQAKIQGEVIVAKPVFILALIECIETGLFSDNIFALTQWLEEHYLKLMTQYTRNSQFDKPADIANPFWHLATDGFWHLHCLKEAEPRTTPSKKWLKENVSYAQLDDDLWILIKNPTWRDKLRNFIIKQKLSKNYNNTICQE